jgi:lipoprotein-anchoring transpeptidase ErfK/SrfK
MLRGIIILELVVLTGVLTAVAWRFVGSPADSQAGPVDGDRSPREEARVRRVPQPPGRESLGEVDPVDKPLGELVDPSVVVEKSKRRLTVFDGGRVVKRYRVAVGSSPGDKRVEGDMRTPEGRFTICVKNPMSRFTRSLGLSYPNIEDARRGLREGLINRSDHDRIVEAIRVGRKPPWKTPLGGEIMIHGYSHKNWTAGCVALIHDKLIHELFDRLAIGTPVEIRP